MRTSRAALIALLSGTALVACDAGQPSSSPSATPLVSLSPAPTPQPTPTPIPTPRFTNEPDAELAGLIPPTAAGVAVQVTPFDELALTPGDIGEVYGEVGLRFVSLVAAYVDRPRTTLYAMRVVRGPVATGELEPYLEEAARYVGIAGLVREQWQKGTIGGHQVWLRPEDNATTAGTQVVTWAVGEFVFLLIGVDAGVNEAIVAALPGEPPPTPRPAPTTSARPSGSLSPAADASP